MVARDKEPRRKRALLGLVLIVVALLLLLALLEGPDGQMGCAPLSPVSAESVPPPGFEPEQEVLLDSPDESAPNVAESGLAAPSASAHVRGRVVDAVTGEPVPWVDVSITIEMSVTGGKSMTSARTGADGTFMSDSTLPPGKLTALVTDDGEDVGRAETQFPLPNDAQIWEIPVPIGPTYPIVAVDTRVPTSSAQWRLRLVETQYPAGSAGAIDVEADNLRARSEGAIRDWDWRRLRSEDGRAFVRWPTKKFPASPTWFPALRIRSDRVFAKGQAVVDGTIGIRPPLSITTEEFVVLSGTITVRGDARPRNLSVLVSESVDVEQTTFERVPFFAETQTDGSWSVETPARQSFQVVAWGPNLSVAKETAFVQSGRTFGPDILLSPGPEAPKHWHLKLDPPPRAPRNRQLVRLRLEETGRFSTAIMPAMVGSEEIPIAKLPIGEYRIESIGVDESPMLPAISRRQKLPAEKRDPAPGNPRAVQDHLIAARAGKESVTYTAGPAGSIFTTEKGSNSWDYSADNAAVFAVWARGHAPALVTEKDFRPRDNFLIAEPMLSPGWGVLLAFRAGDPNDKSPGSSPRAKGGRGRELKDTAPFVMPPLPGVRVDSKGVKLGFSDAEGCVLVTRTARPDELTLVAPGWRMCALERMPGAGSRWWVWMKRDP